MHRHAISGRAGSRLLLTALAIATAGGAVAAQPDAKTPDAKLQAKVLQDLTACPKIADNAKRLACYDAAAGALIQAETTGDVVVMDRAQVREVRRQAFGFQIPSLNIFSRSGGDKADAPAVAAAAKEEEEDANRAVVTVASAGMTPDRKLTLTTSEGAVWVQTDTLTVDRIPAAGSRVTIVRGKVGGFFCDVTRYQSVRCERRK
jgi:hypothetical protein